MLNRALNLPCKLLCTTNIMFKRKFHSHLHTPHLCFGPGHVLMNFLNSTNEVVDLLYSGNVFHMFAPEALKLLRTKTIYEEKTCSKTYLQKGYFFKSSTSHFYTTSNFYEQLLFQHSHFFKRYTFPEQLLFGSTQVFRKLIFQSTYSLNRATFKGWLLFQKRYIYTPTLLVIILSCLSITPQSQIIDRFYLLK